MPPSMNAPLAAVYVDKLEFFDLTEGPYNYGYSYDYGYGYGTVYAADYPSVEAAIVIANRIPQHGETDWPRTEPLQFHIMSFMTTPGGTPYALDPTVRVYLSDGTSRVLAYDQAGGGIQAAFAGPRSSATYRASPGSSVNDELVLILHPVAGFGSTVTVEVEASSGGMQLTETYSYETLDTAAPAIERVLWITPRRCLVTFDRAVETDSAVDSSRFLVHIDGGVEILSATTVLLQAVTPNTAWVGSWLHLTGSANPINNRVRQISAVNPTTKVVTLTPGTAGNMAADDGRDLSPTSSVAQTRRLRASISVYRLESRLDLEAEGLEATDPERIQCSYEPIPVAVSAPDEEWIPEGTSADQVVLIDWHDDVSASRWYDLVADGVSSTLGGLAQGATAARATHQTPSFGLPVRRLKLWDWMPPTDQEDDMAASQLLRRACVVIQDLYNQIAYRVHQMETFEDPARCPAHLLDHLLYDLGNPFRFSLTENQKRRLALALAPLYSQVGLDEGIEALLHQFLGYQLEVHTYWTSLNIWRLGTSRLGYLSPSGATGECILGPGTAYARNCYEIWSPVALSAEQRIMVRVIAEWADGANMHLVRIIEPGGVNPSNLPSYWILGTSVLGSSTTLAG